MSQAPVTERAGKHRRAWLGGQGGDGYGGTAGPGSLGLGEPEGRTDGTFPPPVKPAIGSGGAAGRSPAAGHAAPLLRGWVKTGPADGAAAPRSCYRPPRGTGTSPRRPPRHPETNAFGHPSRSRGREEALPGWRKPSRGGGRRKWLFGREPLQKKKKKRAHPHPHPRPGAALHLPHLPPVRSGAEPPAGPATSQRSPEHLRGRAAASAPGLLRASNWVCLKSTRLTSLLSSSPHPRV